MATLTGYTHATTPLGLIKGPMILIRDGTAFAASRGVRAEFTTDIRQPQIDGLSAPVAGLDRPVGYALRVTGTFLELGEDQVEAIMSGIAGVLAAGVTTFTPNMAGVYLANPAGYFENVEAQVLDGAGNMHAVVAPLMHVTGWPVEGEDRAEVGISLTLEARSGDGQAAPWTYTVTEAGGPPPPTYPIDESDLALYWQAEDGVLAGPAVTFNGTTYNAGPPPRRVFGDADEATFTNGLGAVFADAGGFSVAAGIVTAGGVLENVADARNATPAFSFSVTATGARLYVATFHVGGGITEYQSDAAAVPTGRSVVGFSYDPTLARASRVAFYVDGAMVPNDGSAYTPTGGDGALITSTDVFRLGARGGQEAVDEAHAALVATTVLTAGEMSDINDFWVADGWT